MKLRGRGLLTVLGGLTVAGLAGFVLGQHVGQPWLCTVFSSAEAAAWTQGIGSLLAFFALVWATIYQLSAQKRATRESSQAQARKIAHLIWPSYVDWRSKALRAAVMHGR